MALEPLATVDDLSELGIDTSNAALVDFLLNSVSEEVREAAGVQIARATSTVTIATEASRRIELPGYAPREVTAVSLNDEPLTDGVDYLVRAGSLYRTRGPWHGRGNIPGELTVTYDHGLDEVPPDIVRTVCLYVAAGINAAADKFAGHRGLQYISIDDYREGYLSGTDEVVDPASLTQRTRDQLRARFGGAAPVVYGSTR